MKTCRDSGPSQNEAFGTRSESPLRLVAPVLYRGQATWPTAMVSDLHTLLGPRGEQNH